MRLWFTGIRVTKAINCKLSCLPLRVYTQNDIVKVYPCFISGCLVFTTAIPLSHIRITLIFKKDLKVFSLKLLLMKVTHINEILHCVRAIYLNDGINISRGHTRGIINPEEVVVGNATPLSKVSRISSVEDLHILLTRLLFTHIAFFPSPCGFIRTFLNGDLKLNKVALRNATHTCQCREAHLTVLVISE